MARTTYVKSARKRKDGQPYTCYTCHEPIVEGQAYFWNQPSRFSSRFNWHDGCKAPRPSVLESNEKRARGMEAFEDGYDSLAALHDSEGEYTEASTLMDDIRTIAEAVAEGVREAAEMWRESASNIEDGFGHSTFASEEQEEHADTYDGVADEAEAIADNLDEYDESQWESLPEWVSATIDSASEALADAEGGMD